MCELWHRHGEHVPRVWRMAQWMAEWRGRHTNEAEIRESKEETSATDAIREWAGNCLFFFFFCYIIFIIFNFWTLRQTMPATRILLFDEVACHIVYRCSMNIIVQLSLWGDGDDPGLITTGNYKFRLAMSRRVSSHTCFSYVPPYLWACQTIDRHMLSVKSRHLPNF